MEGSVKHPKCPICGRKMHLLDDGWTPAPGQPETGFTKTDNFPELIARYYEVARKRRHKRVAIPVMTVAHRRCIEMADQVDQEPSEASEDYPTHRTEKGTIGEGLAQSAPDETMMEASAERNDWGIQLYNLDDFPTSLRQQLRRILPRKPATNEIQREEIRLAVIALIRNYPEDVCTALGNAIAYEWSRKFFDDPTPF
jgi:hypothetical protein